MNKKTKVIVFIFFAVVLAVGMNDYKDYGISWDEPIQRQTGLQTYKYITTGDKQIFKSSDKVYGPVFEVVLITAENLLQQTDLQDIYVTRHLITFLFYYVGLIAFYILLYKSINNWKFALLGTAMLIAHPRIFAHAFYNSKDIPLMTGFIFAAVTFQHFINSPTKINTVLHAVVTALTINIRLLGSVVFLLTSGTFLVHKNYKKSFLEKIKLLTLYSTVVIAIVILTRPFLWPAPLNNLAEAFNTMKNFPQSTSGLLFGKVIKSTAAPWYYIPLWILVTTPITYILAFLYGMYKTLKGTLYVDTLMRYILGWLFLPLIAVIVFKSTLYDTWRQMFFIYPAMIYISTKAITAGKHSKKLALMLLVNVILVGLTMVRNHPHQNLYLNLIAGDPFTRGARFERDYWGVSYKQAYERLLELDNSSDIKIYSENFPGVSNIWMVDKNTKARLTHVDSVENADYFITNYRRRNQSYPGQEFIVLTVDAVPIVGVYKL